MRVLLKNSCHRSYAVGRLEGASNKSSGLFVYSFLHVISDTADGLGVAVAPWASTPHEIDEHAETVQRKNLALIQGGANVPAHCLLSAVDSSARS